MAPLGDLPRIVTDKLADRGPRLRSMIEIELPCCDGTAILEPGDVEVRCDGCALVHLLAPDAREPHETPSRVALPAAA